MLLTATAAVALVGAGALVFAHAQPQHGPGHGMPMMQGQGMPQGMPMMQGGGHAGHAAAQAAANASPVTRAFIAANERMHRDMAITFSGNADRDFVAGMIPHHQGAIDMAKVALQYAKDPDVLKLAGDVVKAQEGEIALMTAWLAIREQ
jgi:uncharacterized protein (DUF305 family)